MSGIPPRPSGQPRLSPTGGDHEPPFAVDTLTEQWVDGTVGRLSNPDDAAMRIFRLGIVALLLLTGPNSGSGSGLSAEAGKGLRSMARISVNAIADLVEL